MLSDLDRILVAQQRSLNRLQRQAADWEVRELPQSAEAFNFRSFGGLLDGSTDEGSLFNATLSYINGLGGGTLVLPAGDLISSIQIVGYSDVNVIGTGETRIIVNSATPNHGFQFTDATNSIWQNVTLRRQLANSNYYQAVNCEGDCDDTLVFDNCIFEVTGSGANVVAFFTDDDCYPVLNNCRGYSDVVGFLAQGDSRPRLNGCQFYGGDGDDNAYGGYSADNAAPVITGCYFRGGGQGASTQQNRGFAVTDSSQPYFSGGLLEGGTGSDSAGLYVAQSGIAVLAGAILQGGAGSGGDAVNVLRASRTHLANCTLVPGGRAQNSRGVKMDDNRADLFMRNCSIAPYTVGGYEREITATTTFEFSADHPVTNLNLHLLVQTAGGASATLDIGTTPGGTDIVNGADISATGNVYPALGSTGAYQDIIAAGATIYVTVTPDGGSPDVDLYWQAWTGYTNCSAIIFDGDGRIEIHNVTARSTGLSGSHGGVINAAAVSADNMIISNSHFDRNLNAASSYNPAPIYNCTVVNAMNNITADSASANGTNVVV